jgi:protein-L-isoaspartate(D-aspartate) O-methyltransferase
VSLPRFLPILSPCRAAVLLAAVAVVVVGCNGGGEQGSTTHPDWTALRERMVREQVADRGVRDPRVLEAMGAVPRHEFVTEEVRAEAYSDRALPIGEGQTITQPYVVALMTELMEVGPEGAPVLEVGTGSGYHAAVLAAMGARVVTIENRPRLCRRAAETLERVGYDTVEVRCGDGYGGWPDGAPYDAILVSAAAEVVPEPLLAQLAVGGRLVMPVGSFYQELKVITRTEDGFEESDAIPVRLGSLDVPPE